MGTCYACVPMKTHNIVTCGVIMVQVYRPSEGRYSNHCLSETKMCFFFPSTLPHSPAIGYEDYCNKD